MQSVQTVLPYGLSFLDNNNKSYHRPEKYARAWKMLAVRGESTAHQSMVPIPIRARAPPSQSSIIPSYRA